MKRSPTRSRPEPTDGRTTTVRSQTARAIAPRQNRQAGRRSERQPVWQLITRHGASMKLPACRQGTSGTPSALWQSLRGRYLSGRTTTRSQRHQDNRPLLSPPRFVRAEKSAAGMGRRSSSGRVASVTLPRRTRFQCGLPPPRYGRMILSHPQSPQHFSVGKSLQSKEWEVPPESCGSALQITKRIGIRWQYYVTWRGWQGETL